MANVFRAIKYRIDVFFIKRKIKNFGKNSYIKRQYIIFNGDCIRIGDNVTIHSGANLSCFKEYGNKLLAPSLIIGNSVFINRFVNILCAAQIVIDDFSYLGTGVSIIGENHGHDLSIGNYCDQPLDVKEIKIGKNCWIGDHCIILPGVNIGDNSIVGAGSVVTKSIPSNSICVGNPAKPIKRWSEEKKKWVSYE